MLKGWMLAVAMVVLGCGFHMDCQAADTPSVAEIKQLLRQCVDAQNRTPGVVVGVISTKRTNVVAYGVPERGRDGTLSGDSIFEIGSITKVFTTTLLQQMADNGEVKLEDPISKYLPSSIKTPSWHDQEITLLDLATHTSGLPSLPENFAPKDGDDPWADYTVEQMYDFLSHYKLRRRPGAKFEYSNFGMGLLGHILALRAGTNYEALVVSQICEPLGMNSTRITLTPEMKSRLAIGHSVVGPPVKNWGSLALQGDGAFYSSVNDMLKFLAANMGRGNSPLVATMAKTHVRRNKAALGLKVGLGWLEFSFFGLDYTWHNGGTGGYRSFIGFDPKLEHGAVVLANEANDIDDLGRCLFEHDIYDSLDKFKAPRQRAAVSIDRRISERYVGQYQFNAKHFMTITREGDRLLAKDSDPKEGPYEILPESATNFFLTAADAQISFVTNETGTATQAIFHQDGKSEKAKKVK
jgi:serine-type D-Ala-D-Ala carboxypeptidase/endopeptidase